MVTQGIIIVMLILFFLATVVPGITGIVLLATKKIKGSAFWCGVVSYIIVLIAITIITVATTMSNTNIPTDKTFSITIQILFALFNVIALTIGIMFILKNSRSFKGAVSCGIGFGIVSLITSGFTMISYYSSAAMINSGKFDSMYNASIQMGIISKEQVIELKKQIINLTATDLILTIINSLAVCLMYIAISIILIKGLLSNNKLVSILIALGLHFIITILSILIANTSIAIIVISVISLAALLYTIRLKDSIKEPDIIVSAIEADSFMVSINEAKKENTGNDSEDMN